jgi:hypothetical protein
VIQGSIAYSKGGLGQRRVPTEMGGKAVQGRKKPRRNGREGATGCQEGTRDSLIGLGTDAL